MKKDTNQITILADWKLNRRTPPKKVKSKTTWDHFNADTVQDLENEILSQITIPYDFKSRIKARERSNSEFYPVTFFMAYFKVFLNPHGEPIESILAAITQKFEVKNIEKVNGLVCIECIAHEGPYSETTEDILCNINVLLGPFLLDVFKELKLDVVRLQFLLDELY